MDLKISKMTGKLEGIQAINTNPLSNDFCNAMQNGNHNTICKYCYSRKMLESYRKGCIPAWEGNGGILSKSWEKDLETKFKTEYVRFNGHGELINLAHLCNLIKIAKFHPSITFALWTKRKDLVKQITDIPENLIIIYSESIINEPNPTIPEGFDKVFVVYNENGIERQGVKVNCHGKKCIDCLLCYRKSGPKVIKEKLK